MCYVCVDMARHNQFCARAVLCCVYRASVYVQLVSVIFSCVHVCLCSVQFLAKSSRFTTTAVQQSRELMRLSALH